MEPRIFGSACECDNYRCAFNANGDICSGPTNGKYSFLSHFISSSLLGQCNCTNGELTCICELNTYINKLYTGDACECTEANCYDQTVPYDSSRQVDDRLPARSYVFNFFVSILSAV